MWLPAPTLSLLPRLSLPHTCPCTGYVGTPSILCASPSVSPYKSGWTSQISGQCIRASATVNNVTCATKPDHLFNNGIWPDTCINSAVGASCIATCQVGYTTTPAPRVQCQPNGLWSQILEGSCDRGARLATPWDPVCLTVCVVTVETGQSTAGAPVLCDMHPWGRQKGACYGFATPFTREPDNSALSETPTCIPPCVVSCCSVPKPARCLPAAGWCLEPSLC
jgi:hypothetical protein